MDVVTGVLWNETENTAGGGLDGRTPFPSEEFPSPISSPIPKSKLLRL